MRTYQLDAGIQRFVQDLQASEHQVANVSKYMLADYSTRMPQQKTRHMHTLIAGWRYLGQTWNWAKRPDIHLVSCNSLCIQSCHIVHLETLW